MDNFEWRHEAEEKQKYEFQTFSVIENFVLTFWVRIFLILWRTTSWHSGHAFTSIYQTLGFKSSFLCREVRLIGTSQNIWDKIMKRVFMNQQKKLTLMLFQFIENEFWFNFIKSQSNIENMKWPAAKIIEKFFIYFRIILLRKLKILAKRLHSKITNGSKKEMESIGQWYLLQAEKIWAGHQVG